MAESKCILARCRLGSGEDILGATIRAAEALRGFGREETMQEHEHAQPEREQEERWQVLAQLEDWLETPMILLSFIWF